MGSISFPQIFHELQTAKLRCSNIVYRGSQFLIFDGLLVNVGGSCCVEAEFSIGGFEALSMISIRDELSGLGFGLCGAEWGCVVQNEWFRSREIPCSRLSESLTAPHSLRCISPLLFQQLPNSTNDSSESTQLSFVISLQNPMTNPKNSMFDDQDLGFFANFLGIFIFVLVIAFHYVMADPKYEGN
uniref:Dolichyl-diphosphooligosaccharide--protein glycosyltransferase subunit 4A n=2 Tax=Cucumis melo TaxID=3656 RepID=A0A9I9E8T0_CUCME